MSLTRAAARWGSIKMLRRAKRAIPFLGAAMAIVAIGGELRRKGILRGMVNTALDATPYVGAAKNIIEAFHGDFIPDRPPRHAAVSPDVHPRAGPGLSGLPSGARASAFCDSGGPARRWTPRGRA